MIKIKFIIFLLFSVFLLYANNNKEFSENYKRRILSEYKKCTGDTATSDIKYIINWKENIFDQTRKPEYKKLLKEYMIKTGRIKNILPCEVLNWHNKRISLINKNERILENKLANKNDSDVDSIRVYYELTHNDTSSFDFDNIPFGISRKVFEQVFLKKHNTTLIYTNEGIVVKNLKFNNLIYTVAFHFNQENKFYMYEIQGQSRPADSLDNTVRPEAKKLLRSLEKYFGAPDRSYHVGYFDIKPGQLSPYAKWVRHPYTANVGIGVYHYKYYAKAIVKKILKEK